MKYRQATYVYVCLEIIIDMLSIKLNSRALINACQTGMYASRLAAYVW